MLRIRCPWCGERDETEFQYAGDAKAVRPKPDAGEEAFYRYIHVRDNPKGWHTELWHHSGGCRQTVKVVRNTVTHEIHATGWPSERLPFPGSKTQGSGRGSRQ